MYKFENLLTDLQRRSLEGTEGRTHYILATSADQ